MAAADNFATYLVGGRFDPPFMPTKTLPYIEGVMLESMAMGKVESILPITEDAEFLSVSVGASLYEPRDYWNLYVGSRLVCKSIFTKDVPEGINMTAIIPITAGETVHIEFFNEGGKPKFVWANYQMLK